MPLLSSGSAKSRYAPLGLVLLLWNIQFYKSLGWIANSGNSVFYKREYWLHPLPLLASEDNNVEAVGHKAGFIRYRGRVAYDGSHFNGFQIQQGKARMRTIQGSLEDVLQRRFNSSSIRIVGAGRTDSGVSARGQAFHFDLSVEESKKLKELKHNKTQPPLDHVMNRMLTDEIRVFNVGPAPPPKLITWATKDKEESGESTTRSRLYTWNAIHGSTHKLYSYRICLSVMDPIHRFQRWQVPGDADPVDVPLLKETLNRFEGTHDFRAFAGAVEQAEKRSNRTVNSVRTIFECKLVDESEFYGREGYYRIDIVLSGALYKMVRNMVGTAIDVSRGRVDEATFSKLLQCEGADKEQVLTRKDNRSKPAPPEGLNLERVFYEDDDIF